MDDGALTLLGVVDSGPTGLASKTVSLDYHGPGRGAGNSINALLDAYTLSNDRRYAAKAEELIQRCIHPSDDIGTLGLDDPEYRWSYLVFLQVLGKYLDLKLELQSQGHTFVTETDTEIVAHLVEREMRDDGLENAVRRALLIFLCASGVSVLCRGLLMQ